MAPTPHLGFFTESAGPSSVHLEHVDYYQSEKRRAGVMTPIGLDEQGGASSRVKIIRGPGAATNGSSSNSHPISTSSIGKQTGISDVERKERDKRKSREVTDSVGRYAKDLADRKDE